jgi:hypothetical protein
MRTTIPVSGHLGAAFLSSSVTILLFGVMVYCRGGILRPLLELIPMPIVGSIICLSYFIWFLLWLVLDFILGGRESVGTLPVWTALFLGAMLLGSLIAEMSFSWKALGQ